MKKSTTAKKPAIGKTSSTGIAVPNADRDYDSVLSDVVSLLQEARRASARTVNAILTATYWEIGRRIVECEQSGQARAGYGQELLARLSEDLTSRFGRGFGPVNLSQMKKFYLVWPASQIFQTASEKSSGFNSDQIFQTPSEKSATVSRISEMPPNPIRQTPSAEFVAISRSGDLGYLK